MIKILPIQKIRSDSAGDGHFQASRDGGTRTHDGVDLIASTGTSVLAPFNGKVTNIGQPYVNDNKGLKTISIIDDDNYFRLKILYVKSSLSVGGKITKGTFIGTVQDLSVKYANMDNHIHVELYVKGNLTDPTPYLLSSPIRNLVGKQPIRSSESTKTSTVVYTGESGIKVDDYILLSDLDQIDIDKETFLSMTKDGVSNERSIYDNTDFDSKPESYSEGLDLPIPSGTPLNIERRLIANISEYYSNITETKVNIQKYLPEFVKTIYSSSAFKVSNVLLDHPKVQILVWNRARYIEGGDGWIDISEDVIRCSTESNMQGGDFSIEIGEHNATFNRVWRKVGGDVSVTRGGKREHFFYEKAIHQNDLLFIRMEKLDVEDGNTIHNQWYDMIGLVDAVSTSHANTEISTTIRGRDLSKSMMEDNSYFNPYSIGHINSYYGGDIGERNLNGEFFSVTPFLARSIVEQVDFITRAISSIDYIPSEVFSNWTNPTQFQKSSISSNILTESGGDGESIEVKHKGVWTIIKIFIDDNIRGLRLIDDSITNPNGSIWDLFGKIAQDPFVEYFGDTYGDQFFVTFRQPPFNYRSISKHVVDEQEFVGAVRSVDEAKSIGITNSNPRVIHIEEKDIISQNLSFDTRSYAWYSLEDRGNFAGVTKGLGVSPSLYLNEYAEVFGNKQYRVTSNYSNYKFFENSRTEKELDLYAEQQAQHLMYMVETTCYLPFTRKGPITLKGDRRIKKGHWIYNKSTNEMCYVTGVSNSININKNVIDRTTTLQVERCMVLDYINKDQEFSYFNIVNLKKFKDGVYDTVTKGNANDKFDQKSPVTVNSNVFEFFVKRQQFNEE